MPESEPFLGLPLCWMGMSSCDVVSVTILQSCRAELRKCLAALCGTQTHLQNPAPRMMDCRRICELRGGEDRWLVGVRFSEPFLIAQLHWDAVARVVGCLGGRVRIS